MGHLRMAGCSAGGGATSIADGELPVQMHLGVFTPIIVRLQGSPLPITGVFVALRSD